MTKSNYKKRYFIFIFTVIVIIISNEVILQYKLNLLKNDANVINTAGRQRTLGQRIAKHLLYMGNKPLQLGHVYSIDSLHVLITNFEETHLFLKQNKFNNTEVNNRLLQVNILIDSIVKNGKEVVESPSDNNIHQATANLSKLELPFLLKMDSIVAIYEEEAEKKLSETVNIALVLSALSILILLGEFIFIINPIFNDLYKKNSTLKVTNDRLSDFAYIISHNLRTPVANLKNLLFLVNVEKDETEKKNLLAKFKVVIQNLNGTMNTLSDALKTQNRKENEKENINLEDTLTKTLENLSAKILMTKAVVKHDFSDLKSIVYNKVYLESIFQNLIGNALKYHSPNRNPEITIRSKKRFGKVQLIFKDNGLGIDLKRHGESLFGLNKTFHKHPEAKGIGLFMTRTQIEALGGTITAESEVDKGTIFTISL